MPIVPQFPNGHVKKHVLQYHDRIVDAAIYAMKVLAEELVIYAKNNRNYTDQTGNLTNSIGYVITYRVKVVSQGGFTGTGDEVSAQIGVALANEIASETRNEFAVIIVAGMNYAAYVEAKGYNVILPAELKAKTSFPEMIENLRTKINKIYDFN